MSKPQTKAEMTARIQELRIELEQTKTLNINLAKVLNMTDSGEWVVISEVTRKRYISVIDKLIVAGDALEQYAEERLEGTTNELECRANWKAVKVSENL